jgi:hypothetical protein
MGFESKGFILRIFLKSFLCENTWPNLENGRKLMKNLVKNKFFPPCSSALTLVVLLTSKFVNMTTVRDSPIGPYRPPCREKKIL